MSRFVWLWPSWKDLYKELVVEFHLFTAGEKDDHLVVLFKLREEQENCTWPLPKASPNSPIMERSRWFTLPEIQLSGKGLQSLTPNSEPKREEWVHAAQGSLCQHERHNSTPGLLWFKMHFKALDLIHAIVNRGTEKGVRKSKGLLSNINANRVSPCISAG